MWAWAKSVTAPSGALVWSEPCPSLPVPHAGLHQLGRLLPRRPPFLLELWRLVIPSDLLISWVTSLAKSLKLCETQFSLGSTRSKNAHVTGSW